MRGIYDVADMDPDAMVYTLSLIRAGSGVQTIAEDKPPHSTVYETGHKTCSEIKKKEKKLYRLHLFAQISLTDPLLLLLLLLLL
jgi:hypothetical protein